MTIISNVLNSLCSIVTGTIESPVGLAGLVVRSSRCTEGRQSTMSEHANINRVLKVLLEQWWCTQTGRLNANDRKIS